MPRFVLEELVVLVGAGVLGLHHLVDVVVDVGLVVVHLYLVLTVLQHLELFLDVLLASLYNSGDIINRLVETKGEVLALELLLRQLYPLEYLHFVGY